MNTSARDRVVRLDFWASEVEPEPLAGGITNTNFIVDDQGERFVVRVGDDIPIHGVMRFNEISAARAAHAAAFRPKLSIAQTGSSSCDSLKGTRLRSRTCVFSRTWNVSLT